jgi:hypothetical protein
MLPIVIKEFKQSSVFNAIKPLDTGTIAVLFLLESSIGIYIYFYV